MIHGSVDNEFDVDADGALETLMARIREHIQPTSLPQEPPPGPEPAPPAAPGGSVVRSLSLVTQHLQEMRTLLTLLEQWVRGETERNACIGQQSSARLDRIEAILQETVSRVDALAARMPGQEEPPPAPQAAMRPRDVATEEPTSPIEVPRRGETPPAAGTVRSLFTRLRQRRR